MMEKMRMNHWKLLVIGMFLIISITGCWGNIDLADIAIVSAIGFDKTEDGNYVSSAQFIIPKAFRLNGGGGGGEKTFGVVSRTGKSFNINFHTMYSEIPSKRFSATFGVYVIGEKLARDGMSSFLDISQRRLESRFRSVILIAKGTAQDILETKTLLTDNPSVQLIGSPQVNSLSVKKMLIDLIKDMENEGKEAVVGVVEKKGDRLITQGAAVFKNEKLAGWLNRSETRGFLFASDKVTNIGFLIRNPLDPGNNVTIFVNNSKSRLDMKWKDQKPSFIIHVKAETTISEESGFFDFSKKANIDKIISASNREIKKEIQRTISLAHQKYHCDIFGFGELTEKYYPKFWKKVKKHWDGEIGKIPVQISVQSKLVGTGLIENSLKLR